MQVIDPDHRYQLDDGQQLRFLKKVRCAEKGIYKTVHTGTTNEELLEVLIDRTTGINAVFSCVENENALKHLKEALAWFNVRTQKRKEQNVEGVPRAHVS